MPPNVHVKDEMGYTVSFARVEEFVSIDVASNYLPPRRARTRCRVLPASNPYSAAVLSSALLQIAY